MADGDGAQASPPPPPSPREEAASTVFSRLAHASDDLDAVIRCGPDAILDGMRAHGGSVRVQELGLEGLVQLAADSDAGQCQILRLGGADTALTALEAFASSECVCQHVGWLLFYLAQQLPALPEARPAICTQRVADALLLALKLHVSSAPTQERICWAADILVRRDVAFAGLMHERGLADALAVMLRRHADSEFVVEWGCKVLCSMCLQVPATKSAFASNQTSNSNGVALLLLVLRANVGHEPVAEHGLAALCELLTGDAVQKGVAMQAKFQSGGECLEALFALWRRHVASVVVQCLVLQSLHLVCQAHVPSREQVRARGGVAAVVATMRNHVSDRDIQLYGCMLLHLLMSDNVPMKHAVADEGGVETLLYCLSSHHAETVPVASAALLAILSLSAEPRERQMLLSLNGDVAVVASMKAHIDSMHIIEHGSWVLDNLALDPESHFHLHGNGVKDFLAILLTRLRKIPDRKPDAQAALRHVSLACRHFSGAVRTSSGELWEMPASSCTEVFGACTVS